MKRIAILLVGCLALTAMIATPVLAGKGKVRLAYVEWDCATASTNLAKAVLEEQGYEVELFPVAGAAMWQAVGTGDVDAMVTAWLPVTHATYFDKVQDKVENLGPITGGARLGWAVPTYVTISSIEELNANADKFDGKIIGIDPGAGLMGLSEKAIKEYKLDKLELMEGSGATMTAALSDAIKNKKWVVVTAWSPHWMFGRWELKYLEDPKGVLGEEEHIDTIVRKGLKKDMPEVYAILDRFSYDNPNQLQMLMAWNQEKDADPAANAKRFMKENPDLVKKWLDK
ncbi:MAG: glycine betaine ABC transporter substrate-binding protein [Deltaproteobacteria bacterium]|nr:glycine betaine ABC transporter substrate-binding protein [Deltaproteobacteria bacterium]